MLDGAAQRANMVATQIRTNDVTDARVCRALLDVPRENFVPQSLASLAYMESCVPLLRGRVLLDPRSFGKLLQLAAIGEEDSVLDVGCTTGYSTAVLARLAARVVGLEQDLELAEIAAKNLGGLPNVEVANDPLDKGCPERSPFNVIVVNGAVERRPDVLLEQLADDGRLVCVVRDGAAGHAFLYLKHDGAIGERSAFDAQLPVLPGFEKILNFAF